MPTIRVMSPAPGRQATSRSTFCFGDSHTAPPDVGTIDAFDSVLAGLLEATTFTGSALGRAETTVGWLIDAILGDTGAFEDAAVAQGRALDDYIEAQVHGPIDLAADGEAIMADPSFRDTDVGRILDEIALRYHLDLTWHRGFELDAADVPSEFRGQPVRDMAARIAREHGDGSSRLHAEILGRAARSVVTDPGRWQDSGKSVETLQHIKQLWHVLVRYGGPASS